jgi:alpha-beta hydrolase superfamily lysophospholipase
LTLRSAALSFQVANDGSRLFDGIAQGSIDARQLVQMGVAQSAGQVCEAVRAADSSCVPCPDGARVCFGASIGGLVANRQ